MSAPQFSDVMAVPGAGHIIDAIHPATGRTLYGGKTVAEIQAEYPGAVLMTWDAYATARAAQQQTPIIWRETTAEQYDEMLNVLPPAAWLGGAFLVGEPDDHCIETGRPRFAAYRKRGDVFEVASRPLTVAELRREVGR